MRSVSQLYSALLEQEKLRSGVYPFAPEQRLTEAIDYLARLAHENTDFPIIERGNALALMPQLDR